MSFNSVGPICFEPVSAVTATPSVALGTKRTEAGFDYLYVYNDGGANIASGHGAVLQSGVSGMSVTVSSVTGTGALIGVAVNTLTTGTYGWLLTRGITNIEVNTTSGSVAAGDSLVLGANGMWNRAQGTSGATAGVAAVVYGQALAAIESGASGSAYIRAFS